MLLYHYKKCTFFLLSIFISRCSFKQIIDVAGQIVELPMWGVNKSLNVMVSLGIEYCMRLQSNACPETVPTAKEFRVESCCMR